MNATQFTARVLRRTVAPLLPAGRRLPFRYLLARLEGLVENELRRIDRLGPNRGTAIDIGANEGLFTYRLAGLYDRVHAFEINDRLTGALRDYAAAAGNVEVHGVGLSSADGPATLYIPVLRGRPVTGWASLRPGNLPEAEAHIERPASVRTLDSYGLGDVTFVKADVEGHELELLAGARETLRRNRPVVLIEVAARNATAVREFFHDFRYVERRAEELIGMPGSAQNAIFFPGEG